MEISESINYSIGVDDNVDYGVGGDFCDNCWS